MNREELLQEELSNLYAINKQVKNYFDGSDISFLTEKNQVNLVDYINAVAQNEVRALDVLRNLDANPTNTTDSIVQEMTENLNSIAGQEIDDEVKELGYLMSINRLAGYQILNLENISFLDLEGHMIGNFKDIYDNLKSIKNSFFGG